jgi:putative phosphoesterase
MDTTLIGLISDTHGLLRSEAKPALQGVSWIVHAGDIGNPEVLQQLENIAPVVAVRGNNDHGAWADALPDTDKFDIGGISLYLLHDVKALDLDPKAAGVQVVVSGHSHLPSIRSEEGILFVNPGSAGPRRFKLPVSLGFMKIKDGMPDIRIQMLAI